MRYKRVLKRLRGYLARDGIRGCLDFGAELLFGRFVNARAAYRLWKWRTMLRRSKSAPIYREVDGLRVYLNPKDVGLCAELAVEGVHEPRLTRLFCAILKPGMVVIDVGANIGYFTLLAARRVSPKGKVVALEPFPESYELLEKNVRVNECSNVIAVKLAAGARSGSHTLYVHERRNWNTLAKREGPIVGELSVQVESLDALLAREDRVDVIRMDVEGAEYDVLLGARKTLLRHAPLLVMEVHPSLLGEVRYRGLRDLLLEAGYEWWMAWQRWEDEIVWPAVIASLLRFNAWLGTECWILRPAGGRARPDSL